MFWSNFDFLHNQKSRKNRDFTDISKIYFNRYRNFVSLRVQPSQFTFFYKFFGISGTTAETILKATHEAAINAVLPSPDPFS
jgi:hypothetical protein